MRSLVITVDDVKKQFEIPESWNEVPISSYRKMSVIPDDDSLLLKRMKIASILCNIDLDLVSMMYSEDFSLLESALEWVNGPITDDKSEFILVNGEEFYFYKDFNKLTMGEELSINIIMEKSSGNLLSCYNELLCILLRKKKANGKLESFKSEFMSRANDFDSIPIGKINSLMLFFSNGGELFTNQDLIYSEKKK